MSAQSLHIKKIRVENYKSLKDTELELKQGLNIIIGKNGAGKSNILEFIDKYAADFPRNLYGTINTNFSVSYEYFRQKRKHFFSYSVIRVKSSTNKILPYTYQLTLNKVEGMKEIVKDKKLIFDNGLKSKELYKAEEILPVEVDLFWQIITRHVPFKTPENITWLSTPGKIVIGKNTNDMPSIDDGSGSNFISQLQIEIQIGDFDSLIKEGNNNSDAIKEKVQIFLSNYLRETSIDIALNQYTIIKKIRFNPNINIYQNVENIIIENLYLDFFIDNEWIPWSYLSDGTKRIFYLVSEALSFDNGFLLVEEPELGIHPHQLYKLLDFLKEQSQTKQVIITTHSPLSLDVLDEKELNKIIIARYEHGTKFKNLSKAEISKAKKYMTEVGDLSTYWLHSDLEK